jgi:hypothetical protein
MAPPARGPVIADRLACKSSTCFSGWRGTAPRNRITDGDLSRRRAKRVPKVGVRGHDNPIFVYRAVEDQVVVSFGEPVLAEVDGVVTEFREPGGHAR